MRAWIMLFMSGSSGKGPRSLEEFLETLSATGSPPDGGPVPWGCSILASLARHGFEALTAALLKYYHEKEGRGSRCTLDRSTSSCLACTELRLRLGRPGWTALVQEVLPDRGTGVRHLLT